MEKLNEIKLSKTDYDRLVAKATKFDELQVSGTCIHIRDRSSNVASRVITWEEASELVTEDLMQQNKKCITEYNDLLKDRDNLREESRDSYRSLDSKYRKLLQKKWWQFIAIKG